MFNKSAGLSLIKIILPLPIGHKTKALVSFQKLLLNSNKIQTHSTTQIPVPKG